MITTFFQCKKVQDTPSLAPIDAVKDTIFGTVIKDPYRYMEDLSDAKVINWLKLQEEFSKETINAIAGYNNLKETINRVEKSAPFVISKERVVKSDLYFYLKHHSNEKRPSLYFRKGALGKEELIFKPEDFNSKENYLINYIKPSWDGSKIAVGLTKNDKEFSDLIVVDVFSKKILKGITGNSLPSNLGGIDWLPDNSGFIYVYIPVINSKDKNYLHNSKAVIYRIKDKELDLQDVFSKKNNPLIDFKEQDFPLIYLRNPKNKFVLGAVASVARYRDTYVIETKDLIQGSKKWKPLFKKEEQIKQFIVDGDSLVYRTSKNGTNYQICKTSLVKPNFNSPELLIETDSVEVITDFALTAKGMYLVKTKNGVDAKLYHLKNNQVKYVPLPISVGKIRVSSRGKEYDDLWVETEGWTTKLTRYRFNHSTQEIHKEDLNESVEITNLESIKVKEIEVSSYDGTKVPLSIIYKDSLQLNSKTRLLINGYGAYGYSQTPNLSKLMLNWVNKGGIYAVAHVRGGGEKGNEWRKGGFKVTKPNTWKDFIACTEYFIQKKYSSPENIVIWGRSAGGVLIGRAITERPDLYKAAIIQVGKINTLRSEFGSNGKNSIKEYGTVKDSLEFLALLEMDAYHHVEKNIKYPAVYLTAGMNDARVPAWQPGKFAAKLQSVDGMGKKVFLSVDFEGGHGRDSSTEKKDEEIAKMLTFALWQSGHPEFKKE